MRPFRKNPHTQSPRTAERTANGAFSYYIDMRVIAPVVVAVREGRIYVAAHTFDAFMRPLSSYSFARARGIHILGVRSE